LTALAGIACIGNVLMRGDGSGEPPANLSPEGAKRNGAWRQAMRDWGIPMGTPPDRIVTKPDSTNPGKFVKDYEWGKYEVNEIGEKKFVADKVISHHMNGHYYGKGSSHNRGPHFNGKHGRHYDY